MTSVSTSSIPFSPSYQIETMDETLNETIMLNGTIDVNQDHSFSNTQLALRPSMMTGVLVFIFSIGIGLVVGVTIVCFTSPKLSMSSIV